jgi:hypothetical protein
MQFLQKLIFESQEIDSGPGDGNGEAAQGGGAKEPVEPGGVTASAPKLGRRRIQDGRELCG